MTTVSKPLIDAKYAENAATTQYTAPALTRTHIDKFTATNVTGSPATLTVHLVKAAGTASAANAITFTRSVAAGVTDLLPELCGHVLGAGDFIATLAGTVSAIVIRASGREVVQD